MSKEKLTISGSKDYFLKKGEYFFYLADSVWTAFVNIEFDEWEEYLDYRKLQGFNVLQISISGLFKDPNRHFFICDKNGKPDYYNINDGYFNRAGKMLEIAVKKGFIPALVVLWCHLVEDTWVSINDPESIMPIDSIKPYVEYVVESFKKFNPIYMISGDTNFLSNRTKEAYLIALKTIKEKCPDALTTMHIWGDSTDMPLEIKDSNYIDFYMYQSGHKIKLQHYSYQFAKEFYHSKIKRPILNSEPCFESGGYYEEYGRFTDFDVRKAVWQSLLSGAKAGVAYGAQGIWSWQKKGSVFPNENAFNAAYNWKTALRLKGAWDLSFAKYIFETYHLFDIEPVDIILNKTKEIIASASKDNEKIIIYIPYSTNVYLNKNLKGYKWTLIDFSNKYFGKPDIRLMENKSVIKMYEFNTDLLIIGLK